MNIPAPQPKTYLAIAATVMIAMLIAVLGAAWLAPDRGPVNSRSDRTSGQPPVSPSPAPPEPTPTSPPPPVFPTAATTGVPAGTVLTPVSGELRVTTPAAVLDALDISGNVVIAAPYVQITRSRLHGTGSEQFGIIVESGSVTISDTEISDFANGIGFGDWAALRVNIHHLTEDGVKLGSNVSLTDSYIHDLTPGPGAHSDGAQMQDAAQNVVVRGNTIDVSGWDGDPSVNAALFLKPDFGPSSPGPVTVVGNYLDGGGYILYCINSGEFSVGNITISENRFGRGFSYGPADVEADIEQHGNAWHDTGQPLRF